MNKKPQIVNIKIDTDGKLKNISLITAPDNLVILSSDDSKNPVNHLNIIINNLLSLYAVKIDIIPTIIVLIFLIFKYTEYFI